MKSRKIKQVSSVKEGLANLGLDWQYNPKTRGAFNISTGEKLSRRQFDKTVGLLKQQGFTSFEEKASKRKAEGLKGLRQYKHPKIKNAYSISFDSKEAMLKWADSFKSNDYSIISLILKGKVVSTYQGASPDTTVIRSAHGIKADPKLLRGIYEEGKYGRPINPERDFARIDKRTVIIRKNGLSPH
jgi:hypothetical protein